MTLSRRTTLQWMMAAAAAPLVPWAPPVMAAGPGRAPPFDAIADWPAALPPPAPVKGYGRDPNLMEPTVPWPLTFSKAQRATIDLLGDMILPADAQSPGAGKLGVGGFVDEWISAPYPMQRADRTAVLGGLAWLDALTMADPVSRMAEPVAFMDRLRYLFVLGFYTLPEGKADMGFIGDQPTVGPYPGPTPEALTHFAQMVGQMGLSVPKV